MKSLNSTTWKPGADLPYVVRLGSEKMLAISLPASWIKADRTGEPLLLPPAARALDRLRAMFVDEGITPGFIVSLREAMGVTQKEFGQKIGVSKMTVSRWECGKMRPSTTAVEQIHHLQSQLRRKGVQIGGQKRVA